MLQLKTGVFDNGRREKECSGIVWTKGERRNERRNEEGEGEGPGEVNSQ